MSYRNAAIGRYAGARNYCNLLRSCESVRDILEVAVIIPADLENDHLV